MHESNASYKNNNSINLIEFNFRTLEKNIIVVKCHKERMYDIYIVEIKTQISIVVIYKNAQIKLIIS